MSPDVKPSLVALSAKVVVTVELSELSALALAPAMSPPAPPTVLVSRLSLPSEVICRRPSMVPPLPAPMTMRALLLTVLLDLTAPTAIPPMATPRESVSAATSELVPISSLPVRLSPDLPIWKSLSAPMMVAVSELRTVLASSAVTPTPSDPDPVRASASTFSWVPGRAALATIETSPSELTETFLPVSTIELMSARASTSVTPTAKAPPATPPYPFESTRGAEVVSILI